MNSACSRRDDETLSDESRGVADVSGRAKMVGFLTLLDCATSAHKVVVDAVEPLRRSRLTASLALRNNRRAPTNPRFALTMAGRRYWAGSRV